MTFGTSRKALLWVVIQAVLMGAILTVGWPLASILSLMATYVAFQVLALFSCFLAASEAGVRSELARANNELRATGSCWRIPAAWLNANGSRASCMTPSGII